MPSLFTASQTTKMPESDFARDWVERMSMIINDCLIITPYLLLLKFQCVMIGDEMLGWRIFHVYSAGGFASALQINSYFSKVDKSNVSLGVVIVIFRGFHFTLTELIYDFLGLLRVITFWRGLTCPLSKVSMFYHATKLFLKVRDDVNELVTDSSSLMFTSESQ